MQKQVEVRILPDGRMDAANTARYIDCSEKTLANKRSTGVGPPFVKRGRIFYYKEDVDAWLRAARVTSTTGLQAKAQAPIDFDDDIPRWD